MWDISLKNGSIIGFYSYDTKRQKLVSNQFQDENYFQVIVQVIVTYDTKRQKLVSNHFLLASWRISILL